MSDSVNPTNARQSGNGLWRLFVVLICLGVLAAAGYFGWLAWQRVEATAATQQADDSLIQQLNGQLNRLKTENQQLSQRLSSGEASQRELGEQLSNLAAVQQQHSTTLGQVDATLTSGRTHYQLAAVEELLQLAADRVALHRDRNTAVAALELADTRLADLQNPRLMPVREVIAAERLALLAVAISDASAAVLTLGGLIAKAEALPLLVRSPGEFRAGAAPVEAPLPEASGWPTRLLAGVKTALHNVVRIQRETRPTDALLPIEQEEIIRQLLLSRLEGARLALLRSDAAASRDALASAADCLQRFYRVSDPAVSSAIAELQRLGATAASAPLPVPTRALEALRLQLNAMPNPAAAAKS